MSRYSIFYAGLETKTLCLFNNDPFFKVIGCGKIDYLCSKTLNPFNLPYKYLYQHRINGGAKAKLWEPFTRMIAIFTKTFTSSYYKKYSSHILFISENNIPVYDVILANISPLRPDIIIANVWDMLPKEILQIPTYGTINIHPSKLPQYRGSVPTLMSLKNSDHETAVSYMVLSPYMDRGRIIFQHPIVIEQEDTSLSLEDKIYKTVNSTFLTKIKEYLNGEVQLTLQDESLATYTPKHEAYRVIDGYNETAKDIINKVTLYPHLEPDTLCYLFYKGKKIHIKRTREWTGKEPTTLYSKIFFDIGISTSLVLLKSKYLK
jgi:methionyl-tRNA formyltransferase